MLLAKVRAPENPLKDAAMQRQQVRARKVVLLWARKSQAVKAFFNDLYMKSSS